MEFWQMQINLSDIITIIGLLIPIIGVYVSLRRTQTEQQVRLTIFEKDIEKVKVELDQLRAELIRENKETWRKLSAIEAGQMKTNVFLEENLKRLTAISERHGLQIDGLEDKMDKRLATQDKEIRDILKRVNNDK